MEKEVLNAMKKAGKPLRTGDIAKMIEKESKEVSKAMDGLKKKGLWKSSLSMLLSRILAVRL